MRGGDDRRQLRQHLARLEHHVRQDDEIGAGHDRGEHVRRPRTARRRPARRTRASTRPRLAYSRRITSSESNSPRVATTRGTRSYELSTARSPCPALVFGTMQSGRGAPASAASRARKAVISAPQSSHASPMPRVPRGEPLAHVVFRRVERPAERMVGEVDAVALRGQDAREERRDVLADERFGQRPRIRSPRRSPALGARRVVMVSPSGR